MSTKAGNKSTSEQNIRQPVTNRLLGVYPQKQDGLFMQRIRIFGGRINWPQWRKIAELTSLYSPGTPFHITTRQDIELHNIPDDCVPAVQKTLTEVGLTTFAAGGDSIRNITMCTGSCSGPQAANIFPLAQLVRRHLEQQAVKLNLPRKFKISFSGCRVACAKPWLNDLGFIAQSNRLLTVIGAGSLGARPALGIRLYKDLPAKDILPLCVAAIKFFEQCGDRENRRRARFRHLRERLGNRAFRMQLDARFEQLRTKGHWPDTPAASADRDVKLLCRLQLPNGNINPKEAIQLANIAEPKGAVVRINLEHGLELYGTGTIELPECLAILEANPIIVTCPGSTTCSKAIVNGWAVADAIRQALTGRCLPEMRISISGCPNNCAHSLVADIGLVGMRRRQKGEVTEFYRLFTAGGNGRNDKLAEQSEIICAHDISAITKYFLKSGGPVYF